MAGLTENGLVIRTQAELQDLLERAVRAAVPGIDLSEGPEHQIIGLLSEELALAWQAVLAVHSAFDPDAAEGVLLDKILALGGSLRRRESFSRVTATVTLDAGKSIPAGSSASVLGDPNALFATVEVVTNGGVSTATFPVVMQCLVAGAVAAPAGTLTQLVSSVPGWTAVTNADDAELGRSRANDGQARIQRVVDLAGRGADNYAAIRAAVAKVANVLEVAVYGNETLSTDGDGRPGKSFEVVVWDGDPAGANDDEIAQAIYNTKPGGIAAHGVGESGTALTETASDFVVPFTRATKKSVSVSALVLLAPGTAPGWVTQALAAVVARGLQYTVGEEAYFSQVLCALQDVPVVVAVTTLGLSPGGLAVSVDYDEIIRIDSDDVTLAEAP